MIDEKETDGGLKRRLKNIEEAFQYFADNYKAYTNDRYFLYVSTMSQEQIQANTALNIPILEFNILPPYVSKLLGEFSKNYPGIEVSTLEGVQIDPEQLEFVEGTINRIIYESLAGMVEYNAYQEAITGGFSTLMPEVQYAGDMSFNQEIVITKTKDPTLTFWDPLAENKTKTDGAYSGYCVPMRKEDFEKRWGDYKMGDTSGAYVGSFKWDYMNGTEKMVMVAYYFEREEWEETIVLLADGRVMLKRLYEKARKKLKKEMSLAVMPVIVKERKTTASKIVRRILCHSRELEKEDTLFSELPVIFVDGDSHIIKDPGSSNVRQLTRSIIRDAKDPQRMKSFSGQALAREFQNLSQAQYMSPEEAMPSDPAAIANWKNPQQASILLYKQSSDDRPDVPLNKPEIVFRRPIPNEIPATFFGMDGTIQATLGSYDPALTKLGEHDVSGKAIGEARASSNAAAMPYLVSFENAMQSLAELILDLIAKVYITPRTVPIRTRDGKVKVLEINGDKPGSIRVNYDKNMLGVKVKAGPNFEAQQKQALNDIIALLNVNSQFSEFLSQLFISEGLDVILDNMTFRGVDVLKTKVDAFLQKMEAEKAAQQEAMANQPNPELMKMELMQEQINVARENQQMVHKIDAMEIEIQKQKLKLDEKELLADIYKSQLEAQMTKVRAGAEISSTLIDAHMEREKFENEKSREIIQDIKELAKEMNQEIE